MTSLYQLLDKFKLGSSFFEVSKPYDDIRRIMSTKQDKDMHSAMRVMCCLGPQIRNFTVFKEYPYLLLNLNNDRVMIEDMPFPIVMSVRVVYNSLMDDCYHIKTKSYESAWSLYNAQ